MKDISNLKKKLEKAYAKKYQKDPSDRQIEVASEVNAYWRTVIPDPYWGYSISNLHGRSNSNYRLLPVESTLDARKKLADYCWQDFDLENDAHSDIAMLQKSAMDKRLREGKNVVIYASDKTLKSSSSEDNQIQYGENQKGRTLIAALIMKEAIRLRYTEGHRMQSYDWVEYPVLKQMLAEDKNSMNIPRDSDWLVVDDISLETNVNSQSYVSSLVDPFFISRMKDKLPTILVFRFDINKNLDKIEKSLGVAVSRIISDSKTHIISLSD